MAAPVVDEVPQLFILGSSQYGPKFAAVNGMSAAFAHHMSPEIAVEALRGYRRDFTPRHDGDEPYSVLSVINFASDDDEALLEFEAAWTLTMANLRRGIREPLRPEQVTDYARSSSFRDMPRDGSRVIVGSPKLVAERLLELKSAAQADEIVAVTPSLDRARRTASLLALADAWRAAA